MTDKITLKDFAIRYENIRRKNARVKKCSVKGCPHPRDSTPLLGEDTCCAYHRLLFDLWMCEVLPYKGRDITKMSQEGRRRAFANWLNSMSKEELDGSVLRLAQEPINWEC